ncbi:MAG: hypothetical protein OXT64_18835 [Gammaproteobacteria bacterium]|nr:hypothetical protein [Gammaproteobacteria bacterium]
MTQTAGRHVMLPRFDADRVIKAIDTEQVTLATVVPTMPQAIVESIEETTAPWTATNSAEPAGRRSSPRGPSLTKTARGDRRSRRTDGASAFTPWWFRTSAAPTLPRPASSAIAGGLASYKCPKSVTLRQQPLPLSAANRILKPQLKKEVAEAAGRK